MARRSNDDEDQGSIWRDLGYLALIMVATILATLATLIGRED